jgi:L-ribulose-5-phosphate 3-epimerase
VIVPIIGIMQGRLAPPIPGRFPAFPRDTWQLEFELAAAAQIDAIEWIYDDFGADVNPLGSDSGIESMRATARQSGVQVRSMCANSVMDQPPVRVETDEWQRRVGRLVWLLGQCGKASIRRLVLPILDSSRILDDSDLRRVVETLHRLLPEAERTRVELHLETDLAPQQYARLLAEVDHPQVRVNYDTGNSASLGYDVREEFASYGQRIGSIHIKDRIRGGGSKPLGTGDTDFDSAFECIRGIDFTGDFVLEVARASIGDEVTAAAANRAFVLRHLTGLRHADCLGTGESP